MNYTNNALLPTVKQNLLLSLKPANMDLKLQKGIF